MPAIKLKKATQEYLAEKEREKEAKAAASQAASTPKSTPKAKEVPTPKPQPKAQSAKPKTFLEAEVLFEKRKRTIPAAEQRVITWLDENLEDKEGYCVSLLKLYECYTEACLMEQGNVVDTPVFNRYIKEKFPKGFGLQELSPIKGVLKEKRQDEKRSKPKVVAESLNLKFKDIIDEVMVEIGNPKRGMNFLVLKRKLNTKYPALQFDSRPQKLLVCLEKGIRFGHVELVKGRGKCGFYRVPGESTAEEDKVKKKVKAVKEPVAEGEEAEGKEGETEASKEEEPTKKKSKKRKRKDVEEEENKAKEGEEGKDAEKTDENSEESKKKKAKKAKKRSKKRRTELVGETGSFHGDPQRIDDAFPLAITYMSDPKDASVGKIKKYIMDHYPDSNVEARLKKAMERGVEKGLWEQVTGTSSAQGTYRLQALDFNPSSSETMEDMICQALVACHEPKVASAGLIKKYIIEYHSNFSVDSKPYLFKRALERACRLNKIRQMSGIGASGSFQLVETFVPSPAILAGDVDEEMEDRASVTRFKEDRNEDKYKEVYIVRKTRSGRLGRGKVPPITVVTKQRRR